MRLPGGRLSADQLAQLASASERYGDGELTITARGSVEIRGVASEGRPGIAGDLADAGLLPSLTHERVRNLVATPLAGVTSGPHGVVELDDLCLELDRTLCADPELADLPGRFLFALDDGRGDMSVMNADALATAIGPHDFAVYPGALRVSAQQVVPALLSVAAAFLAAREGDRSVWRMSDLADRGRSVADRVRETWPDRHLEGGSWAAPDRPLVARPQGVVLGDDGSAAIVVTVPFGVLRPEQTHALVSLARGARQALRVTPWRSVVIPGVGGDDEGAAAREALSPVGLGEVATSPYVTVSACTGRPGCASALADVRTDAVADVRRFGDLRVRWSGCGRRCGRGHDTEVDVVATESGYDVTFAAGARR